MPIDLNILPDHHRELVLDLNKEPAHGEILPDLNEESAYYEQEDHLQEHQIYEVHPQEGQLPHLQPLHLHHPDLLGMDGIDLNVDAEKEHHEGEFFSLY